MEEFKLQIVDTIPGIMKPRKWFSLILGACYIAFGFVYFWNENHVFAFVWLALGISAVWFSIVNEANLKKYHITISDDSVAFRLSFFNEVTIPWNSIVLIQIRPITIIFTSNNAKNVKLDLSRIAFRDVKNVKEQILLRAGQKNIHTE